MGVGREIGILCGERERKGTFSLLGGDSAEAASQRTSQSLPQRVVDKRKLPHNLLIPLLKIVLHPQQLRLQDMVSGAGRGGTQTGRG